MSLPQLYWTIGVWTYAKPTVKKPFEQLLPHVLSKWSELEPRMPLAVSRGSTLAMSFECQMRALLASICVALSQRVPFDSRVMYNISSHAGYCVLSAQYAVELPIPWENSTSDRCEEHDWNSLSICCLQWTKIWLFTCPVCAWR